MARRVRPAGVAMLMSKIGALRDLLLALLQEHDRDGAIPTSARFLFYELVQRGELSKERTGARRPDQNLHDALTDIREDGRVSWHWIVDETRSLDAACRRSPVQERAGYWPRSDRQRDRGRRDRSRGRLTSASVRGRCRAWSTSCRWERLALTPQQVREHDLPVIVKHDRRYKDGRPHEAVETEALRQTVLVDILRLHRLSKQEREQRQRRRVVALLRAKG